MMLYANDRVAHLCTHFLLLSPLSSLVLVDTPGQIEIFTWSASGTIISESLAATYPSMILYVVDTPRTTNPVTFMSNMMYVARDDSACAGPVWVCRSGLTGSDLTVLGLCLCVCACVCRYATSIAYKSKLPFLLVFNKTDVTSHEFATTWMNDFDAFSAALKSDDSYMSSLTRSMSLVLDEFYATIRTVGVSAISGEGMPDLFAAIRDLTVEYETVYKPALDAQKADLEAKAEARKERQIAKMKRDLEADENLSRGEKVVLDGGKAAKAAASKKRVPGTLGTVDADGYGLIQSGAPEQRSYIRHPDEEELDDDDIAPDEDRYADEDDAEAALPYDEEEEEEEYVDEDAAAKDKRDFEDFMRKINGNAKAPSSSSIPEDEDEDAEEIDTGKK